LRADGCTGDDPPMLEPRPADIPSTPFPLETCPMVDVLRLARDLIAMDSRSQVSNLPVAERVQRELAGFDVEAIDYTDAQGVPKRNLVARRGPDRPAIALSGHLDTVPDTGWVRDPFDPAVQPSGTHGGVLHGLGSADMKGPIAAMLAAGLAAPLDTPVLFLFTADEEVGKAGCREMLRRSELLKRHAPKAIVIGEPTGLRCIRGHRVDIQFTADAEGVQAHSSTGEGVNANLALIPFLADVRALYFKLREDPRYHDPAYSPPFSDLNFTLDNYGTPNNITVPKATCRVKFRYCKSFDPEWVVETLQASARRHGLALQIRREASPPELPVDHPLVRMGAGISGQPPAVAGLGTEASELKVLAPVIVMGPGWIENAHKPTEHIAIAELERAVGMYQQCLIHDLKM
jgi:acetylornithine deacetylase